MSGNGWAPGAVEHWHTFVWNFFHGMGTVPTLDHLSFKGDQWLAIDLL
jgi:hypothetical protein